MVSPASPHKQPKPRHPACRNPSPAAGSTGQIGAVRCLASYQQGQPPSTAQYSGGWSCQGKSQGKMPSTTHYVWPRGYMSSKHSTPGTIHPVMYSTVGAGAVKTNAGASQSVQHCTVGVRAALAARPGSPNPQHTSTPSRGRDCNAQHSNVFRSGNLSTCLKRDSTHKLINSILKKNREFCDCDYNR